MFWYIFWYTLIFICTFLFAFRVGLLSFIFKILYQNPKDNRLINYFTEDQLFLYNYRFKSEISDDKTIKISTAQALNETQKIKKRFVGEIYKVSSNSYYNYKSDSKNLHRYYSDDEVSTILKLISNCESSLNMEFLSSSDKQYVENLYYNLIFSSLKDIYIYTKTLIDNNKLLAEGSELFKNTKKSYFLTFCKKHLKEIEKIKSRNLSKFFGDSFKDFDSNLGKFTDVLNLVSKIRNSKDTVENLELKVVAKSFEFDVIPKLEYYDRSENKNEAFDSLSDSILSKITNILEEKSDLITTNSEALKLELEVINRYVNTIKL